MWKPNPSITSMVCYVLNVHVYVQDVTSPHCGAGLLQLNYIGVLEGLSGSGLVDP